MSYRDLIANFNKIMESVSTNDSSFPKTLAVNAFRGFLNEFVAEQVEDSKGKEKNRLRGLFPIQTL